MRKLYSVLFSIIFISNSFAQVPTNGLVSEWLFNDGAITNGSNSLLAILGGGAAAAPDRQNIANNAINVNPGGFINFAGDEFDTYTAGASATFAYSFWIKLDAFDNAYRCILAKASFESLCQIAGRQYAVLVTPTGKLQLQAFGSLTGGHARVDGNTTLTVGTWHHIVISVDMATLLASLPATTGLTMYVDGVLQTNTVSEISGNGILPSGMQNGPAHFGFGTYLNTAGSICAGTQNIDAHFDDFRIYDRTLDANEVDALLNDGCDEAVIVAQPQNTSVCSGTATLEITAESGTVSEIRWEWFNGTDWQDMGVSSPGPWDDIVLGNVYEGLFRAKLTSPCGAVSYSDEVTYTWGGPGFTDSPGGSSQNVYLCPQIGSLELQSNAIGESITYQWQERIGGIWTDINGATDPTYTTTASGEFNVNVTACGVTETYVPYNVIQAQNNTVTVAGFSPGSGTICAGQTVMIVTQVSTNSTFSWSPANGTGTGNYSVSPSETTQYTVTATSWQGCVATATATVTVNSPEPIITENMGTLSVSGGTYFNLQWYLDGNPISGANNYSYTPTADGDYTVSVTESGCSGTSDPYAYTGVPTGIEDGAASGLKVYPNPFNAEFIIETNELTAISVMNAMGEVVLSRTVNGRTSIDATSLSAGIYFVREETSGAVMKLVKN